MPSPRHRPSARDAERYPEQHTESGSATVSVPSTTGVGVGYEVSGTGIPTGTTVSQIGSGGSQVTLSQSATVAGRKA